MPTPLQYKAPFEFGHSYHLLFRSIDGVLLFTNQKQRDFFLEKFHRFTNAVFQCWAYSLLDNHSHFIIQLKTEKKIRENLMQLSLEERTKSMICFLDQPDKALSFLDEVVERQVNRFMVSYANTYNNFIERKGSVFQSPFRRSLIAGEDHLQQAIIYVHANAQKHQLVNDFKLHAHNSYWEILSGESFLINAGMVIDFFGGKEKFISLHQEQVAYFYANQWPGSKLEID